MGKKRLLYMYIDNCNGFVKQQFHFGANERFHVTDDEGHLTLTEVVNELTLPENFWRTKEPKSNISEISLLIGENGSGKTSLMRIICKWICDIASDKLPQEKGVLVFGEEDAVGYIGFALGVQLDIAADNALRKQEWSLKKVSCFVKDLRLLYFSNTMTELGIENKNILSDRSMPKRILEANNSDYYVSNDIIINYRHYEFEHQIDMALNGNLEDFPVHYVKMEMQSQDFQVIKEYLPGRIAVDLTGLWKNLFAQYEPSNDAGQFLPVVELLKALFLGIMINLLRQRRDSKSFMEKVEENIVTSRVPEQYRTMEDGFDVVRQIIKDLFLDFERCAGRKNAGSDDGGNVDTHSGEERNGKYLFVGRFMDYLLMELKEYDRSLLKELKLENNRVVMKTDLKTDKEKFKDFWKVYREIQIFMRTASFYWDASSGEQNWVSLFSVLANERGKNIWLFLDEPDNTLHPAWERKLLKKIIHACNTNYRDSSVQVWISTHSPIILSDMPRNSVIYLKDKAYPYEESLSHTFGQNIYCLFNHAFFLEEGVMGTFVEYKIQNILRILECLMHKRKLSDTDLNSLNECQAIVKLLGEPLFKQQMQAYIDRLVKYEKKNRAGTTND